MTKTNTDGFTLIELLMVIGVIGVLAAILVPAMRSAQVSAQQASCASNLRQIGTAVHLFANANGGAMPGFGGHGSNEGSWIRVLAPYLGKVDAVRISPADPDRERKLTLRDASSYAANNLGFGTPTNEFGIPKGPPHNLWQFEHPAETRLFFNVADGKGYAVATDHIHGGLWTSWSALTADVAPDFHRVGKRSADRLNGSSNILFADGHVANVPARELRDLVDRGINPAELPEDL